MNGTLNRATRRRLEQETRRRLEKVEDISARRELMAIARDENAYFGCSGTLDSGKDFGLYFDDEVLCYGEKEQDGFCQFDKYGSDGEHLYGWGGDGLDLEEEIRRCAGG